jgi:ethanolamine utilization protein EutQ (cupin superfamily)
MSVMPKVSRDSVSSIQDFGVAEDRAEDLGEYTVDFVSIRQDHDLAAALSGLDGGQCPCPHWGYVITGELTVRYGEQEETIGPGEAFYLPPGHVPAARAGSEFIQFSPAAQLRDVHAAMARAMAQQGT